MTGSRSCGATRRPVTYPPGARIDKQGSIRICGIFTLRQLGQHRFHRRRRAPDASSNGSRSVLSSVGDVNTLRILMLPHSAPMAQLRSGWHRHPPGNRAFGRVWPAQHGEHGVVVADLHPAFCSRKSSNAQRFGTGQSRTVVRRDDARMRDLRQHAPGVVRNVGLRETSSGDQALDAPDLGHPLVCRRAAPLHQVAQLSIPGERVGTSRRSVSRQSCRSPVLGEPAGKRRSI